MTPNGDLESDEAPGCRDVRERQVSSYDLCGSFPYTRGPLRNTKFTQSRTRQSSMLAPRAAIRAMIAITATLLAGCQSDSVVGAPRDRSPNHIAQTELSAPAPELLWNELTPVNGVLIGTPAGAVITPANDFVVPARTAWNVSTIVIRGAKGLATPDVTMNLVFRANGVGQPGAAIQRFALTAVSSTIVDQTNQIDFRFDLAQPVTFGPGTYWLESECSLLVECGLGPVVGQQAFTTTDDGATWTAGFGTADGPADNLFALVGTEETPESRIADLETTVASLGLDRATETKLEAKLQLALADLGTGDVTGACAAMQGFIDLVNAKTGKKLTSAQAATLIDAATGIRTLIGC
jgi:hypothetical protein